MSDVDPLVRKFADDMLILGVERGRLQCAQDLLRLLNDVPREELRDAMLALARRWQDEP